MPEMQECEEQVTKRSKYVKERAEILQSSLIQNLTHWTETEQNDFWAQTQWGLGCGGKEEEQSSEHLACTDAAELNRINVK